MLIDAEKVHKLVVHLKQWYKELLAEPPSGDLSVLRVLLSYEATGDRGTVLVVGWVIGSRGVHGVLGGQRVHLKNFHFVIVQPGFVLFLLIDRG